MVDLNTLLPKHEEWLMERILQYAKQQGYTKYTSTLVEAWRLSISELSEALLLAYEATDGRAPEFKPEKTHVDDPVAAFGVREAQRHRRRGVRLDMFFGLFKYYRQSYLDLIHREVKDPQLRDARAHFIHRCFDLFELAFCGEWDATTPGELLAELQQTNRELTNEKNRYLTVFESLSDPTFMIDPDGLLLHYNVAASALMDHDAGPGEVYYSEGAPGGAAAGDVDTIIGRPLVETLPWLAPVLDGSLRGASETLRSEVKTDYFDTPRWFTIATSRMLNVSGSFEGAVVIVSDVTMQHSIQQLHEINEERLSLALEATSDGVWDWNVETGEAFFSPRYYTMLGYVPYEFEPSYKAWRDLLHPDDREAAEEIIFDHLKKGQAFQTEFRLRTKSGEWRWIIARGKVAEYTQEGEPLRMVGTHLDNTNNRLSESALARREAQLRAIFDTVGSGIAMMDAGGEIRRANAMLAEMLEYDDADTLQGMNFFDLLRPDFAEDVRAVLDDFDQSGSLTNREERVLVSRKGTELWVDQSLRVFEAEPGMPRSIVFSGTNITERKAMEEEIRTLASTDSLTGVNNRRNFMQLAEFELTKSRRHQRPLAVLMLDIDHFKRINDTYGHHIGDVTLQACTAACLKTLRESDVFGRIGGEEFGAVLGETGEQRALQVAERLRKVLAETTVQEGEVTLHFQVSIGVAMLAESDVNIEAVLQRADEALYQAKHSGRNRVVAYGHDAEPDTR